jgi:hypothetical protein
MTKIDKASFREIVDDFAKEIDDRKTSGHKPDKTVINFRNDKKNLKERIIYEVPINLLRYRKDNGRIATEILSYEKNHNPLTYQEFLRFLPNYPMDKKFRLRC